MTLNFDSNYVQTNANFQAWRRKQPQSRSPPVTSMTTHQIHHILVIHMLCKIILYSRSADRNHFDLHSNWFPLILSWFYNPVGDRKIAWFPSVPPAQTRPVPQELLTSHRQHIKVGDRIANPLSLQEHWQSCPNANSCQDVIVILFTFVPRITIKMKRVKISKNGRGKGRILAKAKFSGTKSGKNPILSLFVPLLKRRNIICAWKEKRRIRQFY